MKVIVGLGNPGEKYTNTRHNIGAMAITRLSTLWGIELTRRNPHALVGQGVVGDETVILARPRTFMNLSGGPVAYLVNRFHIPLEDLLIVYDEMDLPLGTMRIRPGGSNGGHNGLRSIIDTLKTQDVPRMRLGVGRSPHANAISHVLGEFTKTESAEVDKLLDRAVQAVASFVGEGINEVMNKFNQIPTD
jgi:PTH1 family peptidyl-tRNA hydrolase